MKLAEIIKARDAINANRAAKKTDYDDFLKRTSDQLQRLVEKERLLMAGLDLEKIEMGESVLSIRGDVTKAKRGQDGVNGDNRSRVVKDAMSDIANGCPKLRKEALGVKNYSAFGDQRCDMEYGYGPRHGSVVFSIGLNRELIRERRADFYLTDAETESALYLLNALPEVTAAKHVAA